MNHIVTYAKDANGIVTITLDREGAKANIMSFDFFTCLDVAIARAKAEPGLRGVIFASAKPGIFLAGADLKGFYEADDQAVLIQLLKDAHFTLNSIENLGVPVVAAINGASLGGGYELPLACHYRIAADDRSVKVGLPEVSLGLYPAAGGTTRLPRLIGIQTALDQILQGKVNSAAKAFNLGLIHEIVPLDRLMDSAKDAILSGRAPSQNPWRKPDFEYPNEFDRSEGNREMMFEMARQMVLEKSRGLYPAPEVVLRVMKEGAGLPIEQALALEPPAFAELAAGPVAKNMILSLFFHLEDVKKSRGVEGDVPTVPVNTLGVLGAGLMGAGVTYVYADSGLPVVLKDLNWEAVEKGIDYGKGWWQKQVEKGRLTEERMAQKLELITGALDYQAFKDVDFVVEAVFEDLGIKHKVIKECEAALPDHTIFASNTSTIAITKLAEASKRPENFLGMHFFSPVPQMPLVEIIATKKTSDAAIVTTVALTKRIGKYPIVVNDGVGFYTTRILMPYLDECIQLLEDGTPVEVIDQAMVEIGWPVGPCKLLDEVGMDIAHHAGAILLEAFGDRLEGGRSLDAIVKTGRLGRKTKTGFYTYGPGEKKVDASIYELIARNGRGASTGEEARKRLMIAFCNEAAFCVNDGIIRHYRDAEIGAIFGLGFPPYLGGPLRYIDQYPIKKFVQDCKSLQDRLGKRFTPAPVLEEMAKAGKKFFA